MYKKIFARYGCIFENNSEMGLYFKQKRWYLGRYADVSNFLTEIELTNIQLIEFIEKTK